MLGGFVCVLGMRYTAKCASSSPPPAVLQISGSYKRLFPHMAWRMEPNSRLEDAMCGHDAYTLHSTETNPCSGILQTIQDTLKIREWQAAISGSTYWDVLVRRTKFLLYYALSIKSQDRLKIDIDPVLLVFGNLRKKRPLLLIGIQCG